MIELLCSEVDTMNVRDAAAYLGITPKTLYKWKRQALVNRGYLIFGGVAVRFRYRQTGAAGQGRILFERAWLEELKSAMEGKPAKQTLPRRRKLGNINVSLGTPPL